MKRIKLLVDMFCNSADEVVAIHTETDSDICYYDGCGRWCYLPKSEEGVSFIWLGNENPQ